MNINSIKNLIENNLGNEVSIICNCSRNKKEYYKGVITEIYNYIFIVKLDTNKNKSFCYSDVLTNGIEVVFY